MSELAAIEVLAIIQGIYFLLTGLWPIIDINSFQKVTGPKTDLWVVKTVGALVAVIGAVLLVAGISGGVTREIFLLAVGSSAVLTVIDVVYVANGTIPRVYLLDAVPEVMLIVAWVFLWTY